MALGRERNRSFSTAFSATKARELEALPHPVKIAVEIASMSIAHHLRWRQHGVCRHPPDGRTWGSVPQPRRRGRPTDLQGVSQAATRAHSADKQDAGLLEHLPLIPSGLGIALHVAAMLLVMGPIALVVYEKVGLEVLRRAWFNTDRLWAGAFVLAAAATLFTA
jgi:hypothetical protein